MGGDLRNVTTCDKGEGVKKSWNSCDVIYGWLLSDYSRNEPTVHRVTKNLAANIHSRMNFLRREFMEWKSGTPMWRFKSYTMMSFWRTKFFWESSLSGRWIFSQSSVGILNIPNFFQAVEIFHVHIQLLNNWKIFGLSTRWRLLHLSFDVYSGSQ